MIQLPITLEREITQGVQDRAIYFELETIAAARGGRLAGKEPSLTELLYNVTSDEMLSLKQVLDNE